MSGLEKGRLPLLSAAFVIARRDVPAILFSKAFLFFLLGPLFFLAISFGAGALGAMAAGSADDPRLAVVLPEAESSAFAAAHERLDELISLPELEIVPQGASASPATLLADDEGNFGVVLSGSLRQPRLTGTGERIERWEGEVALVAAAATGDQTAYPQIALMPTESSVASDRRANAATAMGALTLLFLLSMLLAGMVLSNLVEEKGNKIIEVLAAAIPMDAVFLGKLFAMLAISLVGIAVWGSVAGIILVLGASALPPIPPPAVGWPFFAALFLVYFAMAYLLIGSVFLAIGSMAATVRDVQTISMPATMLQLLVFFLATFAMTDTGSPVELFAVVFPLSSPYAMLARAAQEPAVWPHFVALAWQVMWVVIFVRAGAALFRRRVMQSGPSGGNGGFLARLRRNKVA